MSTYTDVRGGIWTINSYPVPQFATGKPVEGNSGAYSSALVGGDNEASVKASIDGFASTHGRIVPALSPANRYSENYSTGPRPFTISSPAIGTWPVYYVSNPSDGPLGFYATNVEVAAGNTPSGSIVGPAVDLVTLSAAISSFVQRQSGAGLSDTTSSADVLVSPADVSVPVDAAAEAAPPRSIFSRPAFWALVAFGLGWAIDSTLKR